MSNEEKLKRDRHERMRKGWSIVLITIIVLLVAVLAGSLYVNSKTDESVDISYSETTKTEYQVELINKDLWEEVTPGKLYEAANIDTIAATFNYTNAIKSTTNYEVSYKYDYSISKYIILSKDKGSSKFDTVYLNENDEVIKIKEGEDTVTTVKVQSEQVVSGKTLTLNDNVSFSYQDASKIASDFLERLGDSSVSAHLYVEMTVNVTISCDDFKTSKQETATFKLETQLVSKGTTSVKDLTDPAFEGTIPACVVAGKVAKLVEMIIPYDIAAIAFFVLVLVIFLAATKTKNVDYANKIKSILNGYKSFIQVSTSKFTKNGFVVYKISTITELIEIRDTVQKPVIMIENEDRTCSKFFIIDGEVMYLHAICVEGYEDLLEEDYNREPVFVTPAAVVEEVVVDEPTPVEETPVIGEDTLEEGIEVLDSTSEIVEYDEETLKQLNLCSYTFEAKLILAERETQDFYLEIANYALAYGVKVVRSAKRERIYLGRKLFANLTFSGKKLVVAMALNPSDYADSKYKFKDMSEVRKYAETPFVMKVTSGLKVRQIKDLLTTMFVSEGLENQNLDIKVDKIPTKTKKQLIKEGLVKVNTKTIK